MKKILLTFLLTLMLIFTGCFSKEDDEKEVDIIIIPKYTAMLNYVKFDGMYLKYYSNAYVANRFTVLEGTYVVEWKTNLLSEHFSSEQIKVDSTGNKIFFINTSDDTITTYSSEEDFKKENGEFKEK